jgi:hypothetical protein
MLRTHSPHPPAHWNEGTVGVVRERSTLPGYPLTISTGPEHVAALADALAGFGAQSLS